MTSQAYSGRFWGLFQGTPRMTGIRNQESGKQIFPFFEARSFCLEGIVSCFGGSPRDHGFAGTGGGGDPGHQPGVGGQLLEARRVPAGHPGAPREPAGGCVRPAQSGMRRFDGSFTAGKVTDWIRNQSMNRTGDSSINRQVR